MDMWGFATAQIFSEVSPAMHEDFALQYEAPFLELFGLSCYGCCEQLHGKIDMLRRCIPNLRRISMSPWVDWAAGAEQIGGDFIYSAKPNPALTTEPDWDIGPARAEIQTIADTTRHNGCTTEIVLNGTMTCRNEPQRYDDWADMVQGIVGG